MDKGRLSEDLKVRLDLDTRRRVEQAARREGRSLSQWIRRAVDAALRLSKKAEVRS